MLPESKSKVLKVTQAFDAFGRATWAGLLLGFVAFAIGFGFGIVRVVFVTGAVGPIAAVVVELFVLLPILWFVAGWICGVWKVAACSARYVVGLTAVALLLALEVVFAIGVMKQTLATYMGGVMSPAGLIGLGGQLMLAWLPALSAKRRRPSGFGGVINNPNTTHP
ncbi:MAG TPA: hypothetical protein VF467_05330 [Afipia sp.]